MREWGAAKSAGLEPGPAPSSWALGRRLLSGPGVLSTEWVRCCLHPEVSDPGASPPSAGPGPLPAGPSLPPHSCSSSRPHSGASSSRTPALTTPPDLVSAPRGNPGTGRAVGIPPELGGDPAPCPGQIRTSGGPGGAGSRSVCSHSTRPVRLGWVPPGCPDTGGCLQGRPATGGPRGPPTPSRWALGHCELQVPSPRGRGPRQAEESAGLPGRVRGSRCRGHSAGVTVGAGGAF